MPRNQLDSVFLYHLTNLGPIWWLLRSTFNLAICASPKKPISKVGMTCLITNYVNSMPIQTVPQRGILTTLLFLTNNLGLSRQAFDFHLEVKSLIHNLVAHNYLLYQLENKCKTQFLGVQEARDYNCIQPAIWRYLLIIEGVMSLPSSRSDAQQLDSPQHSHDGCGNPR